MTINMFPDIFITGNSKNFIFLLIVFISLFCTLNKNKFQIPVSKWNYFYIFYITIYFILGMLNGNRLIYIITDYIILLCPLIIYNISKIFNYKVISRQTLYISIIFGILSIIINEYRHFFSGFIILPEFLFLLSIYILLISDKYRSLAYILFFISILVLVNISGKRLIFYIISIIVSYLITYNLLSKKNLINIVKYIVILLIIIPIFTPYVLNTRTASKVNSFLKNTNYELFFSNVGRLDPVFVFNVTDKSTAGRIFELLTVYQTLKKENNLLFGKMLGSSVDLSETQDLSIAIRRKKPDLELKEVRGFHLAFSWILLKFGYFGLVVFFSFLIFIFSYFKNLFNDSKMKFISILSVLIFYSSIFITFGSILLNISFPMFLGYISAQKRK